MKAEITHYRIKKTYDGRPFEELEWFLNNKIKKKQKKPRTFKEV